VNPTRSAKSTDTSLRSAAGVGAGAAAGVPAPNAVPQFPQKRCPGGFAAPQLPHVWASAVPHEPQNRCPAGFSVPQLGQLTALSLIGPSPAANGRTPLSW